MMPGTSFKPLPRAFAVFALALLAMCALAGIMMSEDSDASGNITVGTGQSVTIDVSNYMTSAQLAEFNDSDFEPHITADVGNIYNQGYGGLTCTQVSGNSWKIQPSANAKAGTYTLRYEISSPDTGDPLSTVTTSTLKITEGTGQGTQSSPLSSVDYIFYSVPASVSDYGDYHTETLYVLTGASVYYKLNMASYDPTVSVTPRGSTGTTQSYGGVSVSIDSSHNTTFSGTMGNQALTMNWKYGAREINTSLIPVSNVPVTSISITGASSVNAGSSITLSASVSPSDATNKSVTWSVQSGSSYVTISPNGTSCTVTGKAAGEAIIKCTANDGSGISATKRILVTSSGSSLPDGVSSGSGTSSDPYVFNLSAGTNYSLKVQPVGQFTSYGAVSDPVTVPGITFSTPAGGSVTTLTNLSGGQFGILTIAGTPTTNGTWDIKATSPADTKYYRIVVAGGDNGFTLHYDANGGSGAPSDATYTSSSSTYTAQVSSVKPTKTGHTFLGWSKSSTAATATYQSGANITLSPGTTTLYAVWQEVKQDWFAYLYYNANGGSGAPSAQSDSINAASPSGSKTFTISSAKPTKSGFDFKGWSEDSAAITPSHQPGGTISVPYDSAKTLYAVWQERSYTCYLYFDAQGGSGAPPTMTYTGSSTSAHTFTIPSNVPTVPGYHFLGWSENPGASTPSYQPGSTISVPYNGSKTLYAIYQEGSAPVDMGAITDGGLIEIPVNRKSKMTITAAQDHGAYMTAVSGESWVTYDTERGTGIVFAEPTVKGSYFFEVLLWIPGLPDRITISYTLVVVDDETSTQDWFAYLHYNANGGAGAPTTQSDSINAASPSGSKTFTISSTKPTRSGFIFKGWAESNAATTAGYQPGGTISVPYDSSKILYAVWEEAKLTITSEPATKSLKVGQSWSYTPTANVSGFTVTVTGADWLSVSNGKISGTPTVKGSYNITVTVSKTGYTSDSQSFVVKVYPMLAFESEPGADGIIAYVK